MKRSVLLAFVVVGLLGISTSASAQVVSNVCWSVNGFPVNTSLTLVGTAGSTFIIDVDGYGTSTQVPISGTLTVPPTGDLRLSFLIQAASPSQSAVAWELRLSRTTFDGSGSFRWFDGSTEGTGTATLVSCLAADSLVSEDPVSEGLK